MAKLDIECCPICCAPVKAIETCNSVRFEYDGPRWISVEERLPEDEGWVLAIGLLLKRRSKGNYGWCVPHVAEYRHGRWCDSDGMIPDLEDRSLKITHWMSLPPMPKEE